jgi:hypothetical protein
MASSSVNINANVSDNNNDSDNNNVNMRNSVVEDQGARSIIVQPPSPLEPHVTVQRRQQRRRILPMAASSGPQQQRRRLELAPSAPVVVDLHPQAHEHQRSGTSSTARPAVVHPQQRLQEQQDLTSPRRVAKVYDQLQHEEEELPPARPVEVVASDLRQPVNSANLDEEGEMSLTDLMGLIRDMVRHGEDI